jgi:hypothetical protein
MDSSELYATVQESVCEHRGRVWGDR